MALKGRRQYDPSAGALAMRMLASLRRVSPIALCTGGWPNRRRCAECDRQRFFQQASLRRCTGNNIQTPGRRHDQTHAVERIPVQMIHCVLTLEMSLATRTLHSTPDTEQGMNRSIAPIAPVS
jgi:hypothetical protein